MIYYVFNHGLIKKSLIMQFFNQLFAFNVIFWPKYGHWQYNSDDNVCFNQPLLDMVYDSSLTWVFIVLL